MEQKFTELTRYISANLKPIRQDLPEAMQAFSALAKNATKAGVLDQKTKELIALALGVAAHCTLCIAFHMEALIRLKATRLEIEEALAMAIYMGGGPSLMYSAEALAAFEEFSTQQSVSGSQ
jgi:AhpD family alkylhydroperoxidase